MRLRSSCITLIALLAFLLSSRVAMAQEEVISTCAEYAGCPAVPWNPAVGYSIASRIVNGCPVDIHFRWRIVVCNGVTENQIEIVAIDRAPGMPCDAAYPDGSSYFDKKLISDAIKVLLSTNAANFQIPANENCWTDWKVYTGACWRRIYDVFTTSAKQGGLELQTDFKRYARCGENCCKKSYEVCKAGTGMPLTVRHTGNSQNLSGCGRPIDVHLNGGPCFPICEELFD